MVQKFKDAANILKAKLKQDDLEEALVQATSEENWQTPTNILHEIANAAYNYEKWQRINEFVWEKLKRKNSWRKVLKTLNLVEFLLKNGSSNVVSSFKYEVYQLKSFTKFNHYSDNVDRGEAIRERAKSIVQLLENDQLLEEERVKARNIREKMGSGLGSSNYGSGSSDAYKYYHNRSYGGDSAYSYNAGKSPTPNYEGTFESTLNKYKGEGNSKKTGVKPIVDITGMGPVNKVQTTSGQDQSKVEEKKPFEKAAPKLKKPGESGATTRQEPQKTEKTSGNQNKGLLDDDIIGFASQSTTNTQHHEQNLHSNQNELIPPSNPAGTTNVPISGPNASSINMPAQNMQTQNQGNQQNFGLNFPPVNNQIPQANTYINPMYGTTAPMAAQSMQNQHPQQLINPMYGTTAPMAVHNLQNQQYINPMYGTTAPMAAYNIHSSHNAQLQQISPMYGTTAMYGAMPTMGPQNPQYINPTYGTAPTTVHNQQQYINPMIGTTAPMAAQVPGVSQSNLTNGQHSGNSPDPNKANPHTPNVKWLSNQEKGLIDFSDFGSSAKNEENPSGKAAGNNIKIDTTWNW